MSSTLYGTCVAVQEATIICGVIRTNTCGGEQKQRVTPYYLRDCALGRA